MLIRYKDNCILLLIELLQTTKPNMPSCIPLKSCQSRELRGGILYTDCFCLRRNGLQYDCRRSGCQTSPYCQILPTPICGPATMACAKYMVNPHAEAISSICKMRPH